MQPTRQSSPILGVSDSRAIAAQASTSRALSGAGLGGPPVQLRSMSGQRILQRIHAAGELYLARGARLSCSGQAVQAPALTWTRPSAPDADLQYPVWLDQVTPPDPETGH